jgi:uncharacterized membrane protein YphA (DoxX/SURF4 family)
MRTLGIQPNPGLAAFLVRLSLALVFSAWAYDIVFNKTYYSHVLNGLNWPVAAVLFGLAVAFMVGIAPRVTGTLAAGLLVVFAVVLESHQPIGLPQNAGLAGGALALTLLGAGHNALGKKQSKISSRDVVLAGWLMRIGLAITFLVYGIFKFSSADEYRIVVAEAPLISSIAQVLGAQATVTLVGVVELLLALLMLPGFGSLWGAALQAGALGSFLFALGYPFSYPQDLGMIGIIAAFACTQKVTLPVLLRRPAGSSGFGWLSGVRGRLALDQRGQAAPALSSLDGAVIVVRVPALAVDTLHKVAAVVRGAVRPSDVGAPCGDDGYAVLLPGVESSEALSVAVERVRQALAGHAIEAGVGAVLWSSETTLLAALQLAGDKAKLERGTDVAQLERKPRRRKHVRAA